MHHTISFFFSPFRLFFLMLFLMTAGCTKVGPDFAPPDALMADQWQEAGDPRLGTERADYREWWKAFADPVLDDLISMACSQNPRLHIAGVRVLEARAQLAAAVGRQYPQAQQLFGSAAYNRLSETAPTAPQPHLAFGYDYETWQAHIGFRAAWEIDFWGRFRRAVESADANFLGSIAAYDDALVSLSAEVAGTYVLIRTFEEQIRIAEENLVIQQESLRIARARFRGGATSERDVQQATAQMRSTEATIPQLETVLRQAKDALSTLLGLPPGRLAPILKTGPGIPNAPPHVAVGMPADLLRRRPDIRLAEMQAAAQSALIGVAKADLYPMFSLSGSFGLLSSDTGKFSVDDIFSWSARTASFGPSFQWNIFNYGQITNQVRVQDARLQALILNYQHVVLRAQQEVEDAIIALLKAQERLAVLSDAADAAKRSAELALIQYREGATDYTTVLSAQQALLSQQNGLTLGRADVPQALVAIYRALGGGWEIRDRLEMVPEEIRETMEKRTDWGNLLSPNAVEPAGSEERDGFFRSPEW
ncbi:MAG: efflux transporter outer membrane subunit [Desulfobacteraceae bacterium]|nr:MAG: efflux transporter outer membrane subunit [Desulfobacteraceae bacterium]